MKQRSRDALDVALGTIAGFAFGLVLSVGINMLIGGRVPFTPPTCLEGSVESLFTTCKTPKTARTQ
jgi:hypothetical protein